MSSRHLNTSLSGWKGHPVQPSRWHSFQKTRQDSLTSTIRLLCMPEMLLHPKQCKIALRWHAAGKYKGRFGDPDPMSVSCGRLPGVVADVRLAYPCNGPMQSAGPACKVRILIPGRCRLLPILSAAAAAAERHSLVKACPAHGRHPCHLFGLIGC